MLQLFIIAPKKMKGLENDHTSSSVRYACVWKMGMVNGVDDC